MKAAQPSPRERGAAAPLPSRWEKAAAEPAG